MENYKKNWRNKNKDKVSLHAKRSYQKHRTERIQKVQIRYQEWRDIVLNHYGNICNCCGEPVRKFLTIDHSNNDGSERRKKGEPKGSGFYFWVIKNGFPNDLQILCWNCNLGKAMNGGTCPHKD